LFFDIHFEVTLDIGRASVPPPGLRKKSLIATQNAKYQIIILLKNIFYLPGPVTTMELKRIRVENYKSLKSADIPLDESISVLTGANNAGKSNVMSSISFLASVIKGEISERYDEEFARCIFTKDVEKKMRYELYFTLKKEEMDRFISDLDIKDVKKNEIRRSIGYDMRYRLLLDKRGIAEESVILYLRDIELVYAKGSRKEGIYVFEIMSARTLVPKFPNKADFQMKNVGGGRPPTSILYKAANIPFKLAECHVLDMIYEYLCGIYYMPPIRKYPEHMPVKGCLEPDGTGNNLPEVLHCLLASDKERFGQVLENTRKVFGEIEDISVPMIDGTGNTHVAVKESDTKENAYGWSDLSSGLKEMIFQATFLALRGNSRLMMIAEPEAHLHCDGLRRYMDIIKERIMCGGTKVMIATHSPAVIDQFDMKNIYCIVKNKGASRLMSMKRYTNMEELMEEDGITKGEFFALRPRKFLCIFESRSDGNIFRQFLKRKGIDPVKERIGIIIPSRKRSLGMGTDMTLSENWGLEQAMKFARLIKQTQAPIPFRMILGSDTLGEVKKTRIDQEGFQPGEFIFTEKKAMKDYLLDTRALAKAAHRDIFEMEGAIGGSKGGTEERLMKILGDAYIEASEEMNALIVRFLKNTPKDIAEIIEGVVGKECKAPPKEPNPFVIV